MISWWVVNIFIDRGLEERLNSGGKRSQKEYSSKYTLLTNITRWNNSQKFSVSH